MILDEIRKHPFTTREQLAKIIGITPDGIKKQLDKMVLRQFWCNIWRLNYLIF
ncbi:MAG: winged helix-turn-helix transcriptional regulator [Paludibacteraceae bacterium]|nr:winged helix-turn-helix transcriptional regulator [Paludibacteraceae bacterium]